MQHRPGFRSANIHLSTDRTRVVNYAQWDSAEAFRAMQEDPTTQVHMREAAALATSFEPRLYTVESVHMRPRSPRGWRRSDRPLQVWTISRHRGRRVGLDGLLDPAAASSSPR